MDTQLVVLGGGPGGYIGLELGSVYAALGSRVSVVELTDGLLPGADRDLVKPLDKKLQQEFEAVYLNTQVASLAEKKASIEVTFEGNVDEKVQRFDRVLVAVGRRPNSHGLGLENTVVEVDGRGFVTVDQSQRTADERILAIGDVAGGPMLAHKAAHQGKRAAETLAGRAVVGDVAESIHPHPTLSETLGVAAEVHLGTATDLFRPKRGK